MSLIRFSWLQTRVLLIIAAAWVLPCQAHAADPASSISAPPGFEVSLFADDELAHDIFSLTINARGQVAVSGPGYVRILIDRDGDGHADSYQTYAEGPSTGAQGLYFDGPDLLCTGDGGLLRYRDRDRDGRADGPPEQLLSLKTGGEHFAHAVQRGPDGWWYVILGNLAGISDHDVSLASSPVNSPSAGVLLRIAPDFSGTEVVADGFRNPYDFAFHTLGDVFVFDSDGERDVSLPWYRPTRVFQVLPGTNAGWVSPSWKHPDYYPEMPPVSADCGRGSPTGMVFYHHTRFPAKYGEALFALDWTFGRVFAIPLTPDGSRMRGEVETFLTATGAFGFAPTDISVTPGGDLMISVGGRGTRGGVYRVHYIGDEQPDPGHAVVTVDSLTQCLTTPQPLESWSRARWLPLARQLGRQHLLAAALDPQRPITQRVRAIEIVTELFAGLDATTTRTLAEDPSADVRARAIWSLGRQSHVDTENRLAVVQQYLQDEDPVVVRNALEVILRHATSPDVAPLLPPLRHLLDAPDRYVRQAAWQTVARLDIRQREYVAQDLAKASPRTQVSYALAMAQHQRQPDQSTYDLAWRAFGATSDPILRLDAIRAAQKACGDVGGASQLPPVYDGYANKFPLRRTDFSPFAEPESINQPPQADPLPRRTDFSPFAEPESINQPPQADPLPRRTDFSPFAEPESINQPPQADPLLRRTDFSPFAEPESINQPPQAEPLPRRTNFSPFAESELSIDLQSLTAAFPNGNDQVDQELARLFALLAPDSSALADKLAGKLSADSHPVDDIHFLIVLSRFSIPLPASIRERVATALVQLETKLRVRGLQQDLNWDLRIGELYQELVRRDQELARTVIEHPLFGMPGHVVFTQGLDQELRSRAAERVADYLEQHVAVPWTSDVIFLLGASRNPRHRDLVRQHFDDFSLQGSVIMALAETPDGVDQAKFVAGLRSPDLAVVRASIHALELLPSSEEAMYQFALLDALRRLGADRPERLLRDRVARLLYHNLGQDSGYQYGRTTSEPQTQAVAAWTDYLRQRFPDEAAHSLKSSAEQIAALQNLLSIVKWEAGARDRGQDLFQQHSCAGCHSTRTAVGPDLAGIGKRFSRDDLFTALALPNQDVSPRYNTTLIETSRGKVVSGLIIYESADGVTLRDSTNQTIRIEADEIAFRQELATSLMPTGLLDGLQPQDLADLYAYLRSL